MSCPHCGDKVDESAKFCRRCGGPVGVATRLLDGPPSPVTAGGEPKGPPGQQAGGAGPGGEPRGEEAGSPLDLSAVRKSSVKCAWALGLSALLVHVAVAYLAARVTNAGGAGPAAKDPIAHNPSLYLVQAAIVGIIVLLLFTRMGAPSMGEGRWGKLAHETFHQFMKGWAAIWVSWLLLYLYFGGVLLAVKDAWETHNISLQVTVDFLNIANSAAFFYVFLVLYMPSVATEDEPSRNREFRKALTAVALICSAVFLFSAFCRFKSMSLGPYLSGLLVGISMTYVFGRLDSYYLGVNRWTLAPLYLYAVIQVSGPDLIDYRGVSKEAQQSLFFATVLVLKLYLFIVVNYWLQNGSFAKYFNAASDYVEGMRSKKEAAGV